MAGRLNSGIVLRSEQPGRTTLEFKTGQCGLLRCWPLYPRKGRGRSSIGATWKSVAAQKPPLRRVDQVEPAGIQVHIAGMSREDQIRKLLEDANRVPPRLSSSHGRAKPVVVEKLKTRRPSKEQPAKHQKGPPSNS